MMWLPDGEKKLEGVFSRLDRTPACDGRTDGHLATAYSAYTRRAVKTVLTLVISFNVSLYDCLRVQH